MKTKVINGHLKNIKNICKRYSSYTNSNQTTEIEINDLVYLKQLAEYLLLKTAALAKANGGES